jgi:hypothetical protein
MFVSLIMLKKPLVFWSPVIKRPSFASWINTSTPWPILGTSSRWSNSTILWTALSVTRLCGEASGRVLNVQVSFVPTSPALILTPDAHKQNARKFATKHACHWLTFLAKKFFISDLFQRCISWPKIHMIGRDGSMDSIISGENLIHKESPALQEKRSWPRLIDTETLFCTMNFGELLQRSPNCNYILSNSALFHTKKYNCYLLPK